MTRTVNLHTNPLAQKQWTQAVDVLRPILRRGRLLSTKPKGESNFVEADFVRDMLEEWDTNGVLMDLSERQFNMFLSLAMEWGAG